MISFSNPAWLYGLLGLLIPIGIHLLSRKEGKTIYIGSIRHLTDSDTAQFSSIRLNEIILLILRLLLITLLVFILAGFTVKSGSDETKKWLVIEKGIERDDRYKGLIDSLTSKGFEMHWLAENFPAYEDSAVIALSSNYYELIGQIQQDADTAIVLSYNYANRFKGEKASIPSTIKWLQVEPGEKRIAIQATAPNGDSLTARISNSNLKATSLEYSRLTNSDFEKLRKIDSLRINPTDTINISIFAEPGFDYDRKIIQAAIQAIEHRLPQKFNISVSKQSNEISRKSDFIFWLAEEPCRIKEPTVIGYVHCINSNLPLLIPLEKSVHYCGEAESVDWIISKRLNEENALEESLSFSLAKILSNDFAIYKNKKIASADQRSIAPEAAFADMNENTNVSSWNETQAGNELPLLALLFLILVVERFVAYNRNQ
jgi:hypothetical protein